MDPRTEALLHVTLDVDNSVSESEFNAWYFDEHVADRLQCPGFVAASRFRIRRGAPSAEADEGKSEAPLYLAIYELTDLAVLDSPEYLRLRAETSARSKQMLAAMTSVTRSFYTRIHPSKAPGA